MMLLLLECRRQDESEKQCDSGHGRRRNVSPRGNCEWAALMVSGALEGFYYMSVEVIGGERRFGTVDRFH